ncbi:MAG TPA: hypothetical protein VMY06_11115 [Sedimentisphaerales bacterium]|nr:hypothetical protein [Sedimentisphaerales bacterium]
MSRFETDSLFAKMEMDSRSFDFAQNKFRGNDNRVVCGHIIRVAFGSSAEAGFD